VLERRVCASSPPVGLVEREGRWEESETCKKGEIGFCGFISELRPSEPSWKHKSTDYAVSHITLN